MTDPYVVMSLWFLAAASLVLLVFMMVGFQSRVAVRIGSLTGSGAVVRPGSPGKRFVGKALPFIGTPLLPSDQQRQIRLKTKLVGAGLYSNHALPVFLGV